MKRRHLLKREKNQMNKNRNRRLMINLKKKKKVLLRKIRKQIKRNKKVAQVPALQKKSQMRRYSPKRIETSSPNYSTSKRQRSRFSRSRSKDRRKRYRWCE